MKGQIKGYKGTDENMQCRGMQFEVGKVYEIEGKPELCRNGIHFCERLYDVFNYYPFGRHNRYFEIESGYPDAKTIIGDGKCVATRIKIIRELSPMEVNRCYYGNLYGYGYGDGNENGCGCGRGDGRGNGIGSGDGCGNGHGHGILNDILIWR